MPGHDLDRAIDGLARRQHGAFHRRQAVRLGFTARMVRTRLASGRWIRLASTDVLALPSHPGSWHRQCVAATLSVPAGAVSEAAAAALHDCSGYPRARIQVVTRHGTTHQSPFADVRQSSTVGRIVVVDGIRVVSLADCIIQLARELDVSALGVLIDDAGRTRRHLLDELRDRYAALAHSRLPGAADLRAALDERGPGHAAPPGVLERALHRLFATVPTLPAVVWEATPPWLAAGGARVDALIPDWRLVVEADGRAWHTRIADFDRDRERDALALAHGHATLRFSWYQLMHRTTWCRNMLVAVGTHRRG